jgi:hypothetical protein
MPLTLQFPPPQPVIEFRVLVERFDMVPDQRGHINQDATPDEGDIVAVNVNGFALLAEYGGKYVTLRNGIRHYEFSLLGVVEDW